MATAQGDPEVHLVAEDEVRICANIAQVGGSILMSIEPDFR